MDWWQRNKDFALRVGAGFALLIVALIVRGCVYPDSPVAQEGEIRSKQSAIRGESVPTDTVLRDLARRISVLDEAIRRDAGTIGDLRQGDELRRAHIEAVLRRIGRGDPGTIDEYLRIARSSPAACFARLYDDVRNHYRRVAIERDVPISEDLGFADPRFGEEDVTRAFHALDLVTRAVATAVEEAGVESVDRVVVKIGGTRAAGRQAEDFVEQDRVELTVQTSGGAFVRLWNSFNDPARFVPVHDITIGGKRAGASQYQSAFQVTLELRTVRIDLGTEEES